METILRSSSRAVAVFGAVALFACSAHTSSSRAPSATRTGRSTQALGAANEAAIARRVANTRNDAPSTQWMPEASNNDAFQNDRFVQPAPIGVFLEARPAQTPPHIDTQHEEIATPGEVPTTPARDYAYYIFDANNSVRIPSRAPTFATSDDIMHAFLLMGSATGNFFGVVTPSRESIRITSEGRGQFRVDITKGNERSSHLVNKDQADEILRAVLRGSPPSELDASLLH